MTSFEDLADYVAIPRVTGLRLSPDGSWLAATVQAPGGPPGKPARYVTSIWRISVGGAAGQDAAGQDAAGRDAAPVRLTRSAEGESLPEFLPDGSLLFASSRPLDSAPPGRPARPAGGGHEDGDGGEDGGGDNDGGDSGETDKPALWLLPAAGGEARPVAAPPGGVTGIAAARGSVVVVVAAPLLTRADATHEDARLRKARKEAGVSAILHESGPLRYWDHDLGPDSPHLLAADIVPAAGDELSATRDLTPNPARALDEHSFEVSPDGSQVVTGWSAWDETGNRTDEIHVIDAANGARRVLLAAAGHDFGSPRVSPDGRLVACIRGTHDSYQAPGDLTLVVVPLGGPDSGGPRDLLPGFDRQPHGAAWAPGGESVYFTADDEGRCPVYAVSLADGAVTRLTADDGAYDHLCPAPDGRFLYALRSSVDEPPTPVRLDVTAAGSPPVRLPAPGSPLEVPGRVEEISATTDDGTAIRAWLVLPAAASPAEPAPLLLWAHGGPFMSWNGWSWRWNPWLMAARGYAVLLPDPGLSTGYGQAFVARGYGEWGGPPYTDLMAVTDAAAGRPDIDAGRTAMMGGSFGGYMANWIAGHTGRFRAIVSHAGLWALDQMFGTTDLPPDWRRMFGHPMTEPERYLANSPNRHAPAISTPMLVIHGNKDYRVPVGEALRLWWDLQALGKNVKFLYFPDENHWVLTPGHATVWYQTVFAFLAHHVLGHPWQRPDLL